MELNCVSQAAVIVGKKRGAKVSSFKNMPTWEVGEGSFFFVH